MNTLDLDIKIFPGSELHMVQGLESGKCHGIISAVANLSSKISRQIYEDHHNKKKQTLNNRNCAIRKVLDKHSLISGVHSLLSFKDKPSFYGKSRVRKEKVNIIEEIEYKENRLVMFLNSLTSIHGVSKRSKTDYPSISGKIW